MTYFVQSHIGYLLPAQKIESTNLAKDIRSLLLVKLSKSGQWFWRSQKCESLSQKLTTEEHIAMACSELT